MTRHIPLAGLLSVLVAAAAHPQGTESCSFDTAAVSKPDTVAIGIAAADAWLAPAPAPTEAVQAAQVIALNFTPPTSFSLPFWARIKPPRNHPRGHPFMIGRGLDDFINLTLGPDGHLRDRALDIRTTSPELNAALRAAIMKADSGAEFPVPGDLLRAAGSRIVLRLVNARRSAVVAFPLMTAQYMDARGGYAGGPAEGRTPGVSTQCARRGRW